jgi:hypothetical protein
LKFAEPGVTINAINMLKQLVNEDVHDSTNPISQSVTADRNHGPPTKKCKTLAGFEELQDSDDEAEAPVHEVDAYISSRFVVESRL